MHLLRNATDKTILIVLHDLNLALHFCDQMMLIHDGGLLFHGPITDGLTPDVIYTAYGVNTHMADGRICFDY